MDDSISSEKRQLRPVSNNEAQSLQMHYLRPSHEEDQRIVRGNAQF